MRLSFFQAVLSTAPVRFAPLNGNLTQVIQDYGSYPKNGSVTQTIAVEQSGQLIDDPATSVNLNPTQHGTSNPIPGISFTDSRENPFGSNESTIQFVVSPPPDGTGALASFTLLESWNWQAGFSYQDGFILGIRMVGPAGAFINCRPCMIEFSSATELDFYGPFLGFGGNPVLIHFMPSRIGDQYVAVNGTLFRAGAKYSYSNRTLKNENLIGRNGWPTYFWNVSNYARWNRHLTASELSTIAQAFFAQPPDKPVKNNYSVPVTDFASILEGTFQ